MILRGKIKTTDARAKEIRGLVEKIITKSKRGDLSSIRYAEKFLPEAAVKKMIKDVAPKYLERKGGYTRVTKLGQRPGDGAKMAIIEFI